MRGSSFTLVPILNLLYSLLSEALPAPDNEINTSSVNWTYPSYLPERIIAPRTLRRQSKIDVTQASLKQISVYTKYAGIAATSYCKTVIPLGLWGCKECLNHAPDGKIITTFSTPLTDTHGFVLRSDNDKAIYLVFRGTKTLRQTFDDLLITKVDYTPVIGAKVHAGFYASMKEAIPYYFAVLQSQITEYPKYKVIVIGHSLGAAQALLAGIDLYQREPRLNVKNLFIHTAGCPRVGDPVFAQYVDSTNLTYTRSVHKNDIVPHVPLKSWGFLHAGTEIWARNSTSIVICKSDLEPSVCSDTEPPLSLSWIDHFTYYDINEGNCF